MDGMITAHFFKQKTKMNFEQFFQYQEPNKHLPGELKQINEMKQYLVMHGLDEAHASKFITKDGKTLAQSQSLSQGQNESQDQQAKKTIQDFKVRSKSKMMPRVAKRINNEIEKQNTKSQTKVSKGGETKK